MELRISIDYQEIVSAVKQLSVYELENLIDSITTELSKKKSSGSEDLRNVLLKAPDWSDEDYENYKTARSHFNESRLS